MSRKPPPRRPASSPPVTDPPGASPPTPAPAQCPYCGAACLPADVLRTDLRAGIEFCRRRCGKCQRVHVTRSAV